MNARIEDGFVELYDEGNLVRVNYTDNKATIGRNGHFLHITADQFKELIKLMKIANACALIAGADKGE